MTCTVGIRFVMGLSDFGSKKLNPSCCFCKLKITKKKKQVKKDSWVLIYFKIINEISINNLIC
jgi:hypothetical protein